MSLQLLRTITMTDGGSFNEPLDAVTARAGNLVNYLSALVIKVTIVVASAATSDAIAQARWADILHGLQIFDANGEPWFDQPLNAAVLKELERYLTRNGPNEPAAVSADSNTTNTRVLTIRIPFRLPKLLIDPNLHLQPSALMCKRIIGTWGASGEWGTGQNITETSTIARIYAEHLPLHGLYSRARLKFGAYQMSQFLHERIPVNGRPLAIVVGDDAAGATTTIGATDFTDYQFEGGEQGALNTLRENIDIPAQAYNADIAGDANDAQLALPSGGAARSFPIYAAHAQAKISEIPFARHPKLTLIVGAGTPGGSDQKVFMAVSRARNDGRFAQGIGLSKDFDGSPDSVRKALDVAPGVEGRNGQIRADHPVGPWLARKVSQKIIRAS